MAIYVENLAHRRAASPSTPIRPTRPSASSRCRSWRRCCERVRQGKLPLDQTRHAASRPAAASPRACSTPSTPGCSPTVQGPAHPDDHHQRQRGDRRPRRSRGPRGRDRGSWPASASADTVLRFSDLDWDRLWLSTPRSGVGRSASGDRTVTVSLREVPGGRRWARRFARSSRTPASSSAAAPRARSAGCSRGWPRASWCRRRPAR